MHRGVTGYADIQIMHTGNKSVRYFRQEQDRRRFRGWRKGLYDNGDQVGILAERRDAQYAHRDTVRG
ncbi:hypothetical protein SDC9_211844 [bioreactor metagenome]|uniref:Uncharacterized protein n=1 Tax=bioreactor metagenome TaxID=1076179 RepID=A0A645JY91_9ZZZZ